MLGSPTKSWVRPGQVSHTNFVGDIVRSYLKICVFIPVGFLLLRWFQPPPVVISFSDWLFPILGFVWPALVAQRSTIVQQLGAAEATWYALFYFCLCVSLLLVMFRLVIEMRARGADLAAQQSDALVPLGLLIFGYFIFLGNTGGSALWVSFMPDRWGFFYFRQFVQFLAVVWAALLLGLYVWLGRKRRRIDAAGQ